MAAWNLRGWVEQLIQPNIARTEVRAFPGGAEGTRTPDPHTARMMLYALRALTPVVFGGPAGVEPARLNLAGEKYPKASHHSSSPFTDSNRRPSPYHGNALPTELKGRTAILPLLIS
jgi:hypothetical protein